MADHQEELLPERIWIDRDNLLVDYWQDVSILPTNDNRRHAGVKYIRADLARSAPVVPQCVKCGHADRLGDVGGLCEHRVWGFIGDSQEQEGWKDCGCQCEFVVPQPAAEKWLPIETAPKDGDDVLLYCPVEVWAKVQSGRCCRGEWMTSKGTTRLTQPTHWMPLPARPAAAVPQRCNFCGESKPDLIPATSGFICKDCVGICASMVEKK